MLTWFHSFSDIVKGKNSNNNHDGDDNVFQGYNQEKNKIREAKKKRCFTKMKTIHESMSGGVQFKRRFTE